MPNFKYEAKNFGGKTVTGTMPSPLHQPASSLSSSGVPVRPPARVWAIRHLAFVCFFFAWFDAADADPYQILGSLLPPGHDVTENFTA